TAARTGEVIGARWDERNPRSKVWTLPAERMKGSREHRVPLTDAAIAVLEQMREVRQNEFVFPGDRRAMMSNMAMEMLLRRMGCDVTVHGFRSTFRDWVAERTNFPSEVAEAALAHVVGDKVEAACRRGGLCGGICLRSVEGLWRPGLSIVAKRQRAGLGEMRHEEPVLDFSRGSRQSRA